MNPVQRAGIENFHFDDLRHCYGSCLAIKGVPFENRQKLMRHKDPKMTIRYSHLDTESRREAVNKLPTLPGTKSQQISQQEPQAKVIGFRK